MTRRKAHLTQTPFLILFIVLTLLASMISGLLATDLDEQKRRTAAEQSLQEEWKEKYTEKWREVQDLRNVLGYFGEEGDPDGTVTDSEIIRTDLEGIRRSCLQDDGPFFPPTVRSTLLNLVRIVNRERQVRRHAVSTREILEQSLVSEKEGGRELAALKNRELKDMRRRAAADRARSERGLAQKEGEVTALRERNHDLNANLEKAWSEKAGVLRESSGRIQRLRGRFDHVREEEGRRKVLIPDGEVIRSDSDHGYAYIDLGCRHGVRPGLRFKVYEVGKGGIRVEKGEIRVLRVDQGLSQCSILTQADDTRPISKGDSVWNRFFERGAVFKFVLVGRFDQGDVQVTRERVKRLIRRAGHVVVEEVRADTRYAVLGDGFEACEAAWALVREFNIERLSVRDLREFLGWKERGS